MIKNFVIESLDRLGKDTLVSGILDTYGYKLVCHRSKPITLKKYQSQSINHLFRYQHDCFNNDMNLLHANEKSSSLSGVIFNRSWLGESVYAPLYRGYEGTYVFDLEKQNAVNELTSTRLILLIEDFSKSQHFVDDGLSFDITKREQEQNLFLIAFERSMIADKKMICVTGEDGKFRPISEILKDAIN